MEYYIIYPNGTGARWGGTTQFTFRLMTNPTVTPTVQRMFTVLFYSSLYDCFKSWNPLLSSDSSIRGWSEVGQVWVMGQWGVKKICFEFQARGPRFPALPPYIFSVSLSLSLPILSIIWYLPLNSIMSANVPVHTCFIHLSFIYCPHVVIGKALWSIVEKIGK